MQQVLVYDGTQSVNDFLENPIIKIWKEKEGFVRFSLEKCWGKEKRLAVEYRRGKEKAKEYICLVRWDALLKIDGTKGKN